MSETEREGRVLTRRTRKASLSRYRIDIDVCWIDKIRRANGTFRVAKRDESRNENERSRSNINKRASSYFGARAQNRVGYMDCIERYGPALLFSPSASWRLQREPSTCVARSRSRSKPIAREASAISPISLPDEQTGLWLERGTPNGRASSAPLRPFSSQISTSGRARHGS